MVWSLRSGPAAVAGAAAAIIAFALPASASGEPRVLSAKLDAPAVVGKAIDMTVRSMDPDGVVNGTVVSFGADGSFGSSACALESTGQPAGEPFFPGAAVNVTIPQSYGATGRQAGTIRLQSGGCRGVAGGAEQPVTVTPTAPGEAPVPLVLGIPLSLDLTRPGALSLPNFLGRRSSVKAGASRIDRTTARLARRCPGAHQRVRRNRRGLKRARLSILCLINRHRRARRLRALTADRRLRVAATGHSRSMVRRRFFSHVAPGGVDLIDRLYRVRYLPSRRWAVAENIAAGVGRGGYVTPARVVSAWMRSTGHRHVMLSRRYREAGIGVMPAAPSRGRPGATYTADFGMKAGKRKKKRGSRRRR